LQIGKDIRVELQIPPSLNRNFKAAEENLRPVGGSKRMIGVGLVLGIADMANNDFSNESVGWFAADTIMTGVGLTGWGAPVAGVYFLGRFAYGIYDMSKK
jgi:hypothetical protein